MGPIFPIQGYSFSLCADILLITGHLQVDALRAKIPFNARGGIQSLRPCRHRLRAAHSREVMHRRFAGWGVITGTGTKDRATAN